MNFKERFQIAHGVVPSHMRQHSWDTLVKCLIDPTLAERTGLKLKTRDGQMSKLYSAERDLENWKVAPFKTMKETQAYADKILRSRWWKSRVRQAEVTLTDGRRCVNASCETNFLIGTCFMRLRLPRWSRTPAVILHELSHGITDYEHYYARKAARTAGVVSPKEPAWHGPEFSKNYLEIVRRFMGKDAANELKASFKKHHVKFTVRKPRTGKVVK